MEQYSVTGMSCAACSARVEKAVSKVPGVTACSVSLLTNSMGVEGTASAAEIIKAVEEAGAMQEGKEQAFFYKNVVCTAMEDLRRPVDRLEMIVEKEAWPYPTYGDLMFEV